MLVLALEFSRACTARAAPATPSRRVSADRWPVFSVATDVLNARCAPLEARGCFHFSLWRRLTTSYPVRAPVGRLSALFACSSSAVSDPGVRRSAP